MDQHETNPAAQDADEATLSEQDLAEVAGGHTWPLPKPGSPAVNTAPTGSPIDTGAASDKHGAQHPHVLSAT